MDARAVLGSNYEPVLNSYIEQLRSNSHQRKLLTAARSEIKKRAARDGFESWFLDRLLEESNMDSEKRWERFEKLEAGRKALKFHETLMDWADSRYEATEDYEVA